MNEVTSVIDAHRTGHRTIVPRALTRAQVRDVDRRAMEDYGMTGLVLMENAGRNAAELLQLIGISGRVVVCCGKGNNGGDGFVIARHLEKAGVDVRVLLCVSPDSLTGDAAANFQILQRAQTPIAFPPLDWNTELEKAGWIVDALLGTGSQGAPREPFVSAVKAINASGAKVFAVDVPSGLDCDTGRPLSDQRLADDAQLQAENVLRDDVCIRADHTVTFVARKAGFDLPGASAWTGQVHVADIGVPRKLLSEIAGADFAP